MGTLNPDFGVGVGICFCICICICFAVNVAVDVDVGLCTVITLNGSLLSMWTLYDFGL